MLVSEVMTAPPLAVGRDSTLAEAIDLLGGRGVSALPVVDADGRLVGIVSEADILRQSLPQDPRAHLRPTPPVAEEELRVEDVMTVDPVGVAPHGDCADVAQVLADTGWKSLPVVEDGVLVGMVSRSDLLRALAVSDGQLATAIQEAFAAVGHPEWVAVVRAGHVTLDLPAEGGPEAALATASTVAGVRSVRLSNALDRSFHPRSEP